MRALPTQNVGEESTRRNLRVSRLVPLVTIAALNRRLQQCNDVSVRLTKAAGTIHISIKRLRTLTNDTMRDICTNVWLCQQIVEHIYIYIYI
jgi:hypothetical protein